MRYAINAIAFFLAISANAQWTVVNLHPAGATRSWAVGVGDGQQVGYATFGGFSRASLWTGSAGSWVDLSPAGSSVSEALGVEGGQQAGFADDGVSGRLASLWSGSAGSWVDLSPTGSTESRADGMGGGQQVGYAIWPDGIRRASLWAGTAASWVSLHPAGASGSWAFGVEGGQQVGYATFGEGLPRASMWSGSAGSWVDLQPNVADHSQAHGVGGGQQVGIVVIGGIIRASLWSGTASSWVNLHPDGSTDSRALGVDRGQQVGNVIIGGIQRASLWSGTLNSLVDLDAFVPPGFTSSSASGIWHDGALTYVVGYGWAGHEEALLWVSRASAPTSYSMFRGSVTSGNLASLQNSDDDRLVMRPGAVFTNAEPPIQVILNATAPTSSPSGFSFSLESNASIGNAEQKISLYNYVTGQYEVLDTRLATTTDDTVNVNVTSNTSRFIQPLTMAIRARVSYRALGPVFLYPWLGRIDRAWWTFPG